MSKRSLFLVMLVLICIGCNGKTPEPVKPYYESWEMRVEYNYQPSEETGKYHIATYKVDYYVNNAFEPCSTWFWISDGNSFEVDTIRYFTNDSLLRSGQETYFFQTHKSDDSLEYYLASFKGWAPNKGKPDYQKVWGVTPASSPNIPPTNKYSYLFIDDIPFEEQWETLTKERLVAFTLIHEFGHQRAGLTHPSEHGEYHDPNYDCVMTLGSNLSDPQTREDVLNTMGFCWSTDPDDTTCRSILRSYSR